MATTFMVLVLIIFICGGHIKQCTPILSMKISKITRTNSGLTIWTTSVPNIFPCSQICLQITKCKSFAFDDEIDQCNFYSNVAVNTSNLKASDDFVDATTLTDVSL